MGELKHREHFSTTLLKWQAESIRQLSVDTKIPITRLIEESLDYLFDKYGIEKPKEPNQIINGRFFSYVLLYEFKLAYRCYYVFLNFQLRYYLRYFLKKHTLLH